jgi:serine/threonine protein kinase
MWKRLDHKNIVPLLGMTKTPLQLISEWIPGGNLTEYIVQHSNANRRDLVGVLPLMLARILISALGTRYCRRPLLSSLA